MKKLTGLFIFLTLFLSVDGYAQLTGIKTIPGDYASIAAAITDVNTAGVGSGGVTFNVAAGYTVNITAPIRLTATGTQANPIIFQKSGAGANPLVTRTGAGTITTTIFGGQGDAVIIIDGSDYVTFDGIDVAASNEGIEYGYYLRKASVTNGCKFVAVKNAKITMTKGISKHVFGIYSSNNDANSKVSSDTGITVTSVGGRNENVSFTGNTISNVSSGIVLRGYDHATTPYDFYDQNFVVGAEGAGNTIQNFAGNSVTNSFGVYLHFHNNADVSYNTINNTNGGGTSSIATLYGIFHGAARLSSFKANSNSINLTQGVTYSLYGIFNGATGNLEWNNNNLTLNTSAATSGGFQYLHNISAAASTLVTISNNTFNGSAIQTTGNIYLINNRSDQATPGVTNVFNNVTSGSISKTGGGGTFFCYSNNGSPTGTENIYDNMFSDIVLAGTAYFYGIYSLTDTAHTSNIFRNTVKNITGGTNTTDVIYSGASTKNVYDNKVYGITGGGTVHGISIGYGVSNAYKNSIYNLTSTAVSTTGGVVNGINLFSAITATYIYNNFISDLKAPASASIDAVRGISSTSTTGPAMAGLYYNTIFLNASSTGANFGTSGIFHTYSATATSAALDMRNNIVVNNSTPAGTGRTVAFRRSAATSLANYSEISNNNSFYAGTPGAANLIFYDGTNADQTLADFKARVTPRESASVSVNPAFINSTVAPYNLHIDSTVISSLKGGGAAITAPLAITTDFDGDNRHASIPDIGADEFKGSVSPATPPSVITGNASSIQLYSAVLNGSVNPNEDSTKAYFEYGTSTSYGMRTDTVEVGSGTIVVPVVKNISALSANTQYHYRIVAFNSAGSTQGNDSVFTTLAQPAPVVVTLNTDSIAVLAARFNGTVNPKGADTWYYFEYTGASVTKKTDTVFVGNGSVAVSVNKYVTGLNASSNYSVKLVAYNSGGSTDGNTIVFKTKAYKPQVVTTAATQVTTISGVVNGTVDANGDSSYYYFEYGTTSSFGSVTDTSSAGNGGIPLPHSKTITQLQPGVRYYYRIVAYNSGGRALGLTSSFVTGASSLLIMTSPVGGEGFEPMTEHEITWTSQAVDSVKIEYSSNDGSSWSEVVNSYPAAGGSYIWNIPTGGTTQGRIQISSIGITPVLTTTGTGLLSIGSSSFSELETGTESDINGTSFSGNNDGTMVGDSGLILNTSDGGSNWSPQEPALNREEPKNLNSVSTPSSSTRFAVGDQGTILKTTNGGTTWSRTTLTNNDYHAVSFSDTLYGTTVGSNGVIQRTTNRGVNWNAQTSGTVKALRDIYLSNQTHGSVVGDEGTILFTSNGGGTWSMQNAGTVHNLNGVFFIKNAGLHQIGYAVGDSGVILKTTNGGGSWVQKTSNTRKNLKSLSFFDAQKGTVAGEGGLIMRTSNAGETWVAIVNPGNSNFSRVAIPEGGVATYVTGSGGKAYKDTLGLVPVELTSFTASAKNGEVTLQWITATETNNAGFEVERASNHEWAKVGYVEGKGTSTETSSYIYTQNNVNPGTYLYRLKQIDFDGKYSYSPEIEVTVTAPLEFVLSQNYPNPFNPSTTIKFALPKDANVTLSIYSTLGEKVATIVNGTLQAGNHTVIFDAAKLSSGLYIYKMEAGEFSAIRKMMFLK